MPHVLSPHPVPPPADGGALAEARGVAPVRGEGVPAGVEADHEQEVLESLHTTPPRNTAQGPCSHLAERVELVRQPEVGKLHVEAGRQHGAAQHTQHPEPGLVRQAAEGHDDDDDDDDKYDDDDVPAGGVEEEGGHEGVEQQGVAVPGDGQVVGEHEQQQRHRPQRVEQHRHLQRGHQELAYWIDISVAYLRPNEGFMFYFSSSSSC